MLADGGEVEAIRERTDGHGAEAVLDFVGEGGALEASIAMLRVGGTHYVIGYGGVLSLPAMDDLEAGRLHGRGILIPAGS